MYGENDARITGQADAVKAALAQNSGPSQVEIYPGANHAFFNDTGTNYNEAAAKGAWAKTLAWFREHVCVRCQVSGVRCQVSGFMSQGLELI